MAIDFIGIIKPNGAGHSTHLDSLIIQKGYFKYYLIKEVQNYEYEEDRKIQRFVRNGLTFHSIKYLLPIGLIEYKEKVDTSFLLEENLPAEYFFTRAEYRISNEEEEAALSDIYKGIEKDNGEIVCNTLFLFSDAYTNLKQYEKAIDYISQAIGRDCKRHNWSDKEDIYHTRIALYKKSNQLQKALADYNHIVDISPDKLNSYATLNRAYFKVDYLKDYKGAIADLQKELRHLPYNYVKGNPYHNSICTSTYFALGMAQYRSGDIASAFKNWLKTMELKTRSRKSMGHIAAHFDSIIQVYPQAPELYLSKALALYQSIVNGYPAKISNQLLIAISNINKAEKLGLRDYRINLYRAKIFSFQEKYEQALEEVNKAIEKDNTDTRSFLLRYHIRKKLNKIENEDSDSDLQRAEELSKKWKIKE